MRSPLDVNVLLALFDPQHIHHEKAHHWWAEAASEGWASCPLTQNGFVRIISNPSYPNALRLGDALALLSRQIGTAQHAFWPDSVSLVDGTAFNLSVVQGPKQLTDVYLLGLAVRNEGRLVTFDGRIPARAAIGAGPKHLIVLGQDG